MFISKLFLKNFRSFKESTIEFSKGKNVIVGKNNSGKSNIVKALDLLLSEKFPSYQNITENDFYTDSIVDESTGEMIEQISENFFLEVTLEDRDVNIDLLNSIIKSTAFSQIDSIQSIYRKEAEEISINYELLQNLNILDQNEHVVPINNNYKTLWIKPNELGEFIMGASVLKIFFTKNALNEESSGYGIILINNGNCYISHFVSKKLRDSLITSTVINTLRSPKEDLRIVSYTWFGKLIGKLWNENKDTKEDGGESYIDIIKNDSKSIKLQVDKLFLNSTEEIRKIIARAITHKSVSFKLLNDTKYELYKNIQIFIDDGVDRPISQKGTGIQSAIIIALFSLYCNKFHTTSSLLIAEEPEIFLHPQARRIISGELNQYLSDSSKRQLIINTHSTEFLKGVEATEIIRVYKTTSQNYSQVAQIQKKESELFQEIKRFLWSNNTEIFFADGVILVEGGESYLVPAIFDNIKKSRQYLDYKNFSVCRVNGKGNFLNYLKMLDEFKIDWFLIGDLDCYKDELSKILKYLSQNELLKEIETIKSQLPNAEVDYKKIKDRLKSPENIDTETLKLIFEKFEAGEIKNNNEELLTLLNYLKFKHSKSSLKELILSVYSAEKFSEIQNKLKALNLFIWSTGDLESCYTSKAKEIKASKDLKALEISYLLYDENTSIGDYFKNTDEWIELCDLI